MASDTNIPQVDPCLEQCFLLDEAAKERLSKQMEGLNDADTQAIRSLIANLEEEELSAVLNIAVEHVVETRNVDMLDRLDAWVRCAKLALNTSEESVERNDADKIFDSSLDQLS
jgi:hypothetical protein